MKLARGVGEWGSGGVGEAESLPVEWVLPTLPLALGF
jgi:hypothetical protein